ncbi:MAG: type II toxin-antitoxin system RelE/ParE family toxin [Candidatus Omnitrophota bacterium]
MNFIFEFTPTAKESLAELKKNPGLEKRFKAVKKALKFLQVNPKHPSLQTHEYYSVKGPKGEKVFEAYTEQDTPAAYRIFFYYGPKKGIITIFAIIPHQ